VIREKQKETALRFGKKDEMVCDANFIDGMEGKESDFIEEIDHPEPSVRELVKDAQLEVLRKVIQLWLEKPMTFEATLMKIAKASNQSDLARKKGVSRQYISKAIRAENNNKYKEEIMRLKKVNNLSPDEFAVYRIINVDGCSIRSAAVQLKISPAKVYRMKQRLNLKLQKSETQKHKKK
jgi:DNA-binding phage protein